MINNPKYKQMLLFICDEFEISPAYFKAAKIKTRKANYARATMIRILQGWQIIDTMHLSIITGMSEGLVENISASFMDFTEDQDFQSTYRAVKQHCDKNYRV